MNGDLAKRPSTLWLGLSLAAAAILAAPSVADAQPRVAMSTYRPPSKDPRNIAGAYQPQTDTKMFPIEGGLPPLQPWAKAIYDRRAKAEAAGEPESQDSTSCLPQGEPRVWLGSFPHFIYQVDAAHSASGVAEVVILHELMHLVEHIYLDEKHPNPEDIDPTYLGHQVGRWEGNTLVIDIVGQKADTWIDGVGIPHTDKLHVIQRWKKILDGKQLELMVTLDDPGAFTRPWTARRVYDWSPNLREIEYVCEENNRNAPDEKTGVTGVIMPGSAR